MPLYHYYITPFALVQGIKKKPNITLKIGRKNVLKKDIKKDTLW